MRCAPGTHHVEAELDAVDEVCGVDPAEGDVAVVDLRRGQHCGVAQELAVRDAAVLVAVEQLDHAQRVLAPRGEAHALQGGEEAALGEAAAAVGVERSKGGRDVTRRARDVALEGGVGDGLRSGVGLVLRHNVAAGQEGLLKRASQSGMKPNGGGLGKGVIVRKAHRHSAAACRTGKAGCRTRCSVRCQRAGPGCPRSAGAPRARCSRCRWCPALETCCGRAPHRGSARVGRLRLTLNSDWSWA